MSTFIKVLAVAGTLTVAGFVDAVVLRADGTLPDVQGFGAATVGGSGGRVVTVTSLDDSGPGTLRWALEDLTEPRIVHFDVAGTIQLDDQIEVQGHVSVFGHTAPGPLTITGGRLRVVGDEVIISGLRVRPGNGPGDNLDDRDGISIGKAGESIQNVIIHGNSLTWAVDENLAVWGDVQNVTISNNIIAEALDVAGHSKGDHSMGLLIGGGGAARVSVIGNLFASNANRNPTVKDRSQQIEVVNNLVYNWSEHGLRGEGSTLHAIGNVYIAGPDTAVPDAFDFRAEANAGELVYLEDNAATIRPNRNEGLSDLPVFRGSTIGILPAADVLDHVLMTAGVRDPDLDAIDSTIVASVLNDTGRIINAPDEAAADLFRMKQASDTK